MGSPVYGELEYSEKDIISFPEGMIGFPDSRRFLLLQNPQTEPFRPLQCIDTPYLTFLTVDPRVIVKDYAAAIALEDMKALELDSKEDVAMLAVVILPDDFTKATANLRAPVVLNHRRMLGRQVILPEGSAYSHHHPLVS